MHTTNNFRNGVFLGYPKCCIEAFGDVAVFYFQRPELTRQAAINGFLPCEECAKKLLNKEVTYNELINPNRKCSVPFKPEHTREENETIQAEISGMNLTSWLNS